jgi:hypothetical protein
MAQTIILPDEMHPVDQLAAVRKSIEQLRALERLLVVGIKAEMRNDGRMQCDGRYHFAFMRGRITFGAITADLMRADGLDPENYRTTSTEDTIVEVEQRTGVVNG